MVVNPRLLLADEPTGNLDHDLAVEIMEMFNRINESGTTVLIATHDKEMLQRFPRRTIVLHDGNIVSDSAPPEIAASEEGL